VEDDAGGEAIAHLVAQPRQVPGVLASRGRARLDLDQFRDRTEENFRHVDRRFEQVDQRFEQVDRRLERLEVDFRDLRGEMNARFERVEGRLDALNGTLLRLGAGALVTFVVGFAGLIATQLSG